MTISSFLIQPTDSFSSLQGDVAKARFTPMDGNISAYPENYCRVDLLNRVVYILNSGLDHIDFGVYLNGSPPILEVQFGLMPGGPLYYYLSFPGSFDPAMTTFTTTDDFGILNQSDYSEVYTVPFNSTFAFNGDLFNWH